MKRLSRKIRVLIVDDSALVRKLIRDVIAASEDMEVAGAASNGVEAIRCVTELDPDVVTWISICPRWTGSPRWNTSCANIHVP